MARGLGGFRPGGPSSQCPRGTPVRLRPGSAAHAAQGAGKAPGGVERRAPALRPPARQSPDHSVCQTPGSAHLGAGGGRGPGLGPRPAPVPACPPPSPPHPTPPSARPRFVTGSPGMGDAGAKYEPSHRQFPPHVRSARGAEGSPWRGRLTFALHGVHEVPLIQLAAQLLLQAEAADANNLLHVRQVLVLVVSLAVNRALRGPKPESPGRYWGNRGLPLTLGPARTGAEAARPLHPTTAT